MKFIISILFVMLCIGCKSFNDEVVIASDSFSADVLTDQWLVEMDSLPGSSVLVENGKLVMNTAGGVTVWLNKKLSGNYKIEYYRTVVVANGVNDRLSDLNQFWMATDPIDSNLFTRKGKFEEYDSVKMYYAGVGGNYNSTTRFRRYDGFGEKKLVFDFNDESRLLKPNHKYHIVTIVNSGRVQFFVDNILLFDYVDENPITEGFFGFRSTWSQHHIEDFRVVAIK